MPTGGENQIPLAQTSALPAVRHLWSRLWGQPWLDHLATRSGDMRGLDAALDRGLAWLARAQDVCPRGVSSWQLLRWQPTDVAATAALAIAFREASLQLERQELAVRADRLVADLIAMQQPDGSFASEETPTPFAAGIALSALSSSPRDERARDAAMRASAWIVARQDRDGLWSPPAWMGTRLVGSATAAALAQAARATADPPAREAAQRAALSVARSQRDDASFTWSESGSTQTPRSDVVALVAGGLRDCGELLEMPDLVAAGQRTADRLMHQAEISRAYFAHFDARWRASVDWVSVDGAARLGRLCLGAWGGTRDPRYFNASLRLADFIGWLQEVTGRDGALPSAYPLWAGTTPLLLCASASTSFVRMALALRQALLELARDGAR